MHPEGWSWRHFEMKRLSVQRPAKKIANMGQSGSIQSGVLKLNCSPLGIRRIITRGYGKWGGYRQRKSFRQIKGYMHTIYLLFLSFLVREMMADLISQQYNTQLNFTARRTRSFREHEKNHLSNNNQDTFVKGTTWGLTKFACDLLLRLLGFRHVDCVNGRLQISSCTYLTNSVPR